VRFAFPDWFCTLGGMQSPRNVGFGALSLLVMLGGQFCFGDNASSSARAEGVGRVTIVYQHDAIRPENMEAIRKIKASGVFERMADRLTEAVALPHDLQVVITDDVPKGIDNPTTEVGGRRIFWPAGFSKETHVILTEFLPEVVRDKGMPRVIAQDDFNADVLNVWGSQFGHEFGHAVIHQLNLPLTGLEEDSADGFATFFTINDRNTGPNAALGAAVLFDALGSKRPKLTMEDFSSDHAVILQRVYNFVCSVLGSDPQRLDPLVTDGYLPQSRALLCGKEWSQLAYGWWTVLEPHLTQRYRKETESIRQQARQNLEYENSLLPAKLKQMRDQR
jgi:hypothetical protein